MNCHSELMEDSLRNIEPVQLGVEQMCEASVKLLRNIEPVQLGVEQMCEASVKLPSHSPLWLQRAVVTVHCDYCAQWSQCTVVAAHSGHSAL